MNDEPGGFDIFGFNTVAGTISGSPEAVLSGNWFDETGALFGPGAGIHDVVMALSLNPNNFVTSFGYQPSTAGSSVVLGHFNEASITAIPEPSTTALFATGLLTLLARKKIAGLFSRTPAKSVNPAPAAEIV